jgi:hypothetical protein
MPEATMRTIFMLFVCLLMPTLASAEWKEASDATWHALLQSPAGSPTTIGAGDLALDPNFNGGAGWERFDFNDANGKRDRGLAVVPVGCGFLRIRYLVFGSHQHGNTWDVVIAKINGLGVLDTSFGIGGRMTVATPLRYLTDMAVDASATHFYFSGWKTTGTATDKDFAVTCIDASGVACEGFGTLGTVTKWFDLDTNKMDYATSIRYRPAVGANPARLLVAGIAVGGTPAAPSSRLGVVAIDPATGVTITGFGNAGKVVLQVGEVSDLAAVELYDMALSASSMPGGERLYLAGSYQRAPLANNDIDGYVMAINPQDGTVVTGFNGGGLVPIHNDIGPPGNKFDEVSGIQVLPDGKVAMVGRSIGANAKDQLLLARATPSGLDSGFCGGGVCAKISADPTSGVCCGSIGVRPMTHDLVVASSETRSPGVGQSERLQVVEQYSASGNTLHGRQEISYPSAAGQGTDSTVSGLYIGSDLSGGYAFMVGTTRWNDAVGDEDITVARMVAADEMFTNGFGAIGAE